MGGYDLFAYAPVHSVSQAEDGVSWRVTTPRGSVTAGKVVFATNAYSQAIVPELSGLIIPTRGALRHLCILASRLIEIPAQAVKLSAPPAGLGNFPRFDPS